MTFKHVSYLLYPKPIYYLIFLIIFLSCQEKDASKLVFDLELVKIDSFVVKRDTRFKILDHHGTSGNYLGYDPITKSFLVIGQKGEIIDEVKRSGEGPNEYSSSLSTAAFYQVGGGIVVQSANELIWYNENWEIKKRWKYAPSFGVTVYGGPRFKTPYYLRNDATTPFVFTSFFPNVKVPFGEIQSLSPNGQIIEVFESNNDSLVWKLPVDFKQYTAFEPEEKGFDQAPVYHLDENSGSLLLTFDHSLTIGSYSLNTDFELTKAISLTEDKFADGGKGKNIKVFPVTDQGLGILRYSSMSELELKRKKEVNSNYTPLRDSELYRFYFIDSVTELVQEIPFPKRIEPNSELLPLGGNRILMRNRDREDVEIDQSSYSIFIFRKKEK